MTRFRACCDIIGTEGRIEVPQLFTGEEVRVTRIDNPTEQTISFRTEDRFITQARCLYDCILKGTEPLVSLEDSLNNVRLLMGLENADRNT